MRGFVALALLTAVVSTASAESARVNGTTLHYETRGSGEPIVLLQGGQLGLRMWDDQFAALSKQHRVIRYDVRGFGRSGPWGAPYRALDDLAGLLDHLGVKSAHLVGLSLGGRIAIDFALEHPVRVKSLCLAGPGLSGFEWSEPVDTWYGPIVEAAARGDSLAAADLWLKSPYMAPAMEDDALARRLRTLSAENSRVWMHRETEVELSPPAAGRLGEIRVPVLILIGTRDTRDILRIADILAKEVPHAKKLTFDHAGHMLNLERPAEFNQAVIEFIDGL